MKPINAIIRIEIPTFVGICVEVFFFFAISYLIQRRANLSRHEISFERPSKAEFLKHQRQEKHKKGNPLRDVILGGQDGLVNALGIILGVSAATSDTKVLIATVLAATFAESL